MSNSQNMSVYMHTIAEKEVYPQSLTKGEYIWHIIPAYIQIYQCVRISDYFIKYDCRTTSSH